MPLRSGLVLSWRIATVPMVLVSVLLHACGGVSGAPDTPADQLARTVAELRQRGVLVNWERVPDDVAPETPSVQTASGLRRPVSPRTAALLLDVACKDDARYRWRRQEAPERYLVYPTTNAIVLTATAPVTCTNRPLGSIVGDHAFTQQLGKLGLLVRISKSQRLHWRHTPVSLRFQGGTLGDFLDHVAASQGTGVCWQIEKRHAVGRAPIAGKMTRLLDVKFSFPTLPGGRIENTKRMLKTATDEELRKILGSRKYADQSAVALEIGGRLWRQEKEQEARKYFSMAVDSAGNDEELWMAKYKMLRLGCGYPTATQANTPLLTQMQNFVGDSVVGAARRSAMWWLLKYHIQGVDDKAARDLINGCKDDSVWRHSAAIYYNRKLPNAPMLRVPPPTRAASVPTETEFIRKTRRLVKTADGELKIEESVQKE